MASATKPDPLSIPQAQRDPAPPAAPRPQVKPRRINVAFTSIVQADIEPGELVFNEADSNLVQRKDTTIYRYASTASRTI